MFRREQKFRKGMPAVAMLIAADRLSTFVCELHHVLTGQEFHEAAVRVCNGMGYAPDEFELILILNANECIVTRRAEELARQLKAMPVVGSMQ